MNTKWQSLQNEFTAEHRMCGISIVQWCANKKLNYHTARRYIKRKMRNANNGKICENNKVNAQGCANDNEKNLQKSEMKTKQPNKGGAPIGNRNAMKHGGYSKAVVNETLPLSQRYECSELESISQRIIFILDNIQRLDELLSKEQNTNTWLRLLNQKLNSEQAIDRLIARRIKLTKPASTEGLQIAKQKLKTANQVLQAAKKRKREAKAALAATRKLNRKTKYLP